MAQNALTNWFPDRPLTWSEVILLPLLTLQIALYLFSIETVSWRWIIGGFVTTIVALGPARTTTVGERIGSWFQRIGATGRAAAIGLFVVAIGVVTIVEPALAVRLGHFGYGGLTATVLFGLAYLLHSRDVDGWWG